jgi:membrane-associated phospholipid phosphatase
MPILYSFVPGCLGNRVFFSLILLASLVHSQATRYYDANPKLDGILLSSAVSMGILGQWRYRQMTPYQGDFSSENLLPWDKPFAGQHSLQAARASDYMLGFSAVPITLWTTEWLQGSMDSREYATTWLMATEVLLLQSGLNLAVRSLQVWPRPFMLGNKGSAQERSSAQASGSFYSGHASGAFSVAAFSSALYATRHSQGYSKYVFTAGAFSIASSVAILRVMAGKHYPSDVIVGALVGSFIGWLVPALHEVQESESPLGIKKTGISAVPGHIQIVLMF